MISDAMRRVVAHMRANQKQIGEFQALEFFARGGDWHTQDYADHVSQLHAWEIDPSHFNALRQNLPKAKVLIGDSFELARLPRFKGMFNLVVLDNPQGIFGANNEYCEHFEALALAKNLLVRKQNSFVLFNVNSKPFSYHLWPDWRVRREQYYQTEHTELLNLDWLTVFYRERFIEMGFHVDSIEVFHRDPEYLHYFLAEVRT